MEWTGPVVACGLASLWSAPRRGGQWAEVKGSVTRGGESRQLWLQASGCQGTTRTGSRGLRTRGWNQEGPALPLGTSPGSAITLCLSFPICQVGMTAPCCEDWVRSYVEMGDNE